MKLSVITINYNNLSGLRKTVDSVMSQTWRGFEWIIIDGGSTDGSKELIEQFHHYLSFWCSETDRGIFHAMNKGVGKAIGEYIIFMNSGDSFYDGNVLKKINSLHSDADIISGQAIRTDNNEMHFKYNENLFMQLYLLSISHQGAFIRRSLLIKYPYDETLKTASDWKFWIQTIIWGQVKVERTDIIVARYDMTGISSACNNEDKDVVRKERNIVINEFFPELLRKELDKYASLCRSPYTVYSSYLCKNNHFLFALGWRLLKIFVSIDKLLCKILKSL